MPSKLKVAYFAFSEEYGAKHAGFTHSYNIVKALSRLISIKAFFNSNIKLKNHGKLQLYGVIFPNLKNLFKINPIVYIKSYLFVKKNLKDVDLVHERFHVNPIDLAFISNKKYVLEVNDPAMLLHKKFVKIYNYFVNLKFKRCDCIITQTQTLKKILSKFTNKPIYVVSNGVDTSKFKLDIKNDIRKKYKIGKDEVIVIFVGAFMQWHGVSDVVKLAKKFSNVKFLMVGNGPEFNEVLKNSQDLKNLILVGSKSKEEVPEYLAAADIAIAPFNTSKFKDLDNYGFWWCPVKLFEYMAAGKPIVSYNYYEVSNIVKEGGLLAKSGDFNDFTRKLKELLDNKNLRLNLGSKARKIALGYDWKYRAEEVFKVYLKCLKK